MVAAALAASAVAVQEESLQVADVYLQKAIGLYTLVRSFCLLVLLAGGGG
jgi:hypothetical protein